MIRQKQKGFTLLELLIVIAIIGILASITIISYPSYTKKARTANALRFSDNLRGSLQQDMVAWWKFDETSGTIAKDTWWNQLHGTVSGATWVEGIKGNALSFNGSSNYVNLGSIGTVSNWNPDAKQTTITAWFNPASSGHRTMIFSDNCIEIGMTIESNERACGWAYTTACTPAAITMNEWHFGVVTWDVDTRQAKFYFDGKLQSTANFSIGNGLRDAPFNIGRDPCTAGTYFIGQIDDVQIYSTALPLSVIQQHYTDGLATHQNLAIK